MCQAKKVIGNVYVRGVDFYLFPLEFQCTFQLAEMSTADSIKPVLNANLPTETNGQVSLDNPLFNS
jgi:hypothetical protein